MNHEANSQQQPVIIREQVESGLVRATFATGCFWCMEAVFQETPGIKHAISGYAGGTEYNPTYEDVYMDRTGHKESVMVYYNPKEITYEQVLSVFWQNIDPTDPDGQFVDKGPSYTTAIFYESEEQRVHAETSKKALEQSGTFDKPIVTEILPFTTFYEAEECHQEFYKKSPGRYQSYAGASGRKEFKSLVWKAIQRGEQ